MRTTTAVSAVNLAFLAFVNQPHLVNAAPPAHASPESCPFEPGTKVLDACASYTDLDNLNELLNPYVRNLATNTDFFSYYRLNLYNKKCPFWSDENGLCGNIACAVTTLENQEDVPKIWRAEELSKLVGPKAQHPGREEQKERQRPLMGELGDDVGESCVVEYDDECDERDYCVPEDEGASFKGDYVSLADNPERFTGYSGEGAHQVWEAIYRENCFSTPSPGGQTPRSAGSSISFPGVSQNQAQAAMDFQQVVKAHGREQALRTGSPLDALDFEGQCLEKRVFYRIISGMHASISTHLCYDYLNKTTGEWGPNVQCYKDRFQNHPERISNLYFNYAMILRAVGKLRSYVPEYSFCTGDPMQDVKTKRMITVLADAIPAGPQIFDERVMFQTADGISLKEDFRNRFRNVSRIMDCVGCDKCRLWGKVQVAGFGTAMKVLFEFGNEHEAGDPPMLRRTELVALINTLDKISTALKALEHFREIVALETKGLSEEAAKVLAPSQVPKDDIDFSDLDELDDFDDGYSDEPRRPGDTLLGDFMDELDRVWRAYKFVLSTWLKAPQILSHVFFMETGRLVDMWLGKPVRPRSWEFIQDLIKPFDP